MTATEAPAAVMVPAAGVRLSDEQGDAVDRLVAGANRRDMLQTLGGYAGVGKTVVVSELSRRLPGFAVCAYTGKAADILRRKGLYNASTIHSLIYRPETDPRTGRVKFNLIRPQELSATGFLVDEASMVGGDILRDLQSFRRPIIAVGDHGQLPPVGNDAGLMANPQIRLETIHRNAGPIARFAEMLRKGHNASEWTEVAEPGKPRVYVVDAEEATEERLARADQIICAYNRTRVALNRRVRRTLGYASSPEQDLIPVKGDRVMCLRNNRDFGVFNGQQGTVGDIRPRGYEMLFKPAFASAVWLLYHPEAFDKEKPPEYDNNERSRFNTELPPIPFDYAYAATCHKCQGDEFGKVIVMEERCGIWEHSRWAYTAASRGKEAILWVKQKPSSRKR